MILGAQPITLQRFTAGVGADRRGTLTLESETTIMASVQPLTDRQRQALPELLRQSVDKRLYTRSEVRTVDQLNGTPGDRIVIDGEVFEVVAVKRWPQLLAHYEVDIQRAKEPDNPTWAP